MEKVKRYGLMQCYYCKQLFDVGPLSVDTVFLHYVCAECKGTPHRKLVTGEAAFYWYEIICIAVFWFGMGIMLGMKVAT